MIRNINAKVIVTFVISLFLTIETTGCSYRPVAPYEDGNVIGGNERPRDYCLGWESRYQALDDTQKQNLAKYGLVSHGNGDKSGDHVISSQVIEDCAERIKIGRYFHQVSQGEVTLEDREFVSRNSAEVVRVLRTVWNAPDLKEKDLFFTEKELKDQDLEPFLAELLRKNEYKTDLVYANIERPILSLKPSLLFVLQRERRLKDVPRQIYVLIALQKIDNGLTYIPELRGFAKSKSTSKSAREGIIKIIKKFESHGTVSYSDVEAIGLEIEDEE